VASGSAPHPALGPLADLLGTWSGEGRGDYPTIEPFGYLEDVTFGHVGKPFLAYGQRTRHPETGAPMHAEAGYLRPADPAGADGTQPLAVEFVLAHPTGIAEVEEGTFVDGVLDLRTTSVGRTGTAKAVRGLRRRFVLDGDRLTYDLWMAHADTPETHHLQANLQRTKG
jgi:hypothetical protein